MGNSSWGLPHEPTGGSSGLADCMPLGSFYLGSVLVIFYLPSSRTPRLSYFCPTCGQIWARVVTGSGEDWVVTNRGCAEHTSHAYDNVPGSLLQPFQWWDSLFETQFATALRTLPADWLAYEFKMHVAAAEKETPDDSD